MERKTSMKIKHVFTAMWQMTLVTIGLLIALPKWIFDMVCMIIDNTMKSILWVIGFNMKDLCLVESLLCMKDKVSNFALASIDCYDAALKGRVVEFLKEREKEIGAE